MSEHSQNFYSEKHPHEPEIAPVYDTDGRCLICVVAVRDKHIARLEAQVSAQNSQLFHLEDENMNLRAQVEETKDALIKVHNPARCEHDRLKRASVDGYMVIDGPEPCEVCALLESEDE